MKSVKGSTKGGMSWISKAKTMPVPQLYAYIKEIADRSYTEGYMKASRDVPDGSMVIDPNENMVYEWDYDEFLNMLLEVDGINKEIAEKVIEKINDRFESKYNSKLGKGD